MEKYFNFGLEKSFLCLSCKETTGEEDKMAEVQNKSEQRLPKYEQLKQKLLAYIAELPEEQTFLPFEQELAQKFQVGRTTVSHALKLLREEGFIVTSKKAGSRILKRSYSDIPRSAQKNGAGQNVAFLFANTVGDSSRTTDFRWELCDELEQTFGSSGVQLFIYNLRENNWNEWRDPQKLIASLKERNIGFVIFSPCIDTEFDLEEHLRCLVAAQFKLTLVVQSSSDFRQVEELLAPGIDYIMLNTLYSIRQALEEHYAGAERFFYIANEFSRPWSMAREKICCSFCSRHNIPYDFLESEYLVINDSFTHNLTPSIDAATVDRLLALTEDSAVRPVCFCANDYAAYSLITRLKERGINPGRYEIIGFDNEQQFRSLHFSSFSRDAKPQVAALLQFYQEYIANPEQVRLRGIGARTYARFIRRDQ